LGELIVCDRWHHPAKKRKSAKWLCIDILTLRGQEKKLLKIVVKEKLNIFHYRFSSGQPKHTRTITQILLMRKIYFPFLLAFSLLTCLGTLAQTTITIPPANTNSGSSRVPLGTYWGYERAAMIFTPAEVAAVGQIQRVAFYFDGLTSAGNMVNLTIYMKTRSTLFTATSTYATETTGATIVYGPATLNASTLTAGQWNTITLSTPFTYSGTDNLEVIVETNAGGTGNEGETAKAIRATTQPSNQYSQYWAADNSAPTTAGTLLTFRPNIQLTIQEPPCVPGSLSGGTIQSTTLASCAGASFTLSINGASVGDGLTYQWQSSPDNSTWTDIPSATGMAFTTTQNANTYYRRKMTCAGTDAFSTEVQVTAIPALTLPVTEDFTSTTFPPSCWVTSNNTYTYRSGVSGYGTGLGSVKFDFYSTSATMDFVTPLFAAVPADYRLTFDHAYATYLGENDQLRILYSTDGGVTFIALTTYAGGSSGPLNTAGGTTSAFTPTAAQWNSKALALPVGTNRLMFRGISAFGNNLYVDNIKIAETPPCLPPTDLVAIPVTPTSEALSWTASTSNPGNGYEWEVRTSGAAGSGATGRAANGATAAGVVTASATGLSAATSYSLYVRSYCSVGLYSEWTLAKTFTTICTPTNVPYAENFDAAVSPNFPDCIVTQDMNGGGKWNMYYDGDVPASTQPNSIYYAYDASVPGDDWFFLRGLNLVAGKTYTLNFVYKASDGPDFVENLEVKYGAAPNAASMTSAPLFRETAIATNIDGPFTQASVSFTVPANGVYYFGFHAFSDADQAFLLIDDISVESCPTPTNVTALSSLPTTAQVSFTSAGSNFVVEYGPVGFVPGTGATAGGGTVVTGTASPISISGLTANTLYDIYVRQNCSAASEFSMNAKVTVRTQCNPVNVPYLQDFTGVFVPDIPACTSVQDINGTPTWSTFTPNPAWGFNGTTLRYLYDAAKPGNDWFYIQGVNLQAGKQYELSYKYGPTDPLYPESMKVAIGTAAEAGSMTTTLADYPNIVANAQAPFAKLDRILFTVPANGAYYVGFQAYSQPDQFTLYLDSIVVREVPVVDVGITNVTNAPSCPASNYALNTTLHNYNLVPIDFAATPVTVTATVSGTAAGTVSTTVNSGTLAAGGNLAVSLPAFTFAQGVYTLEVTTSSPDDGVASNDKITQLQVVNGSPAAPIFTPANPQVCAGGTVQVSTQFTAAAPAPTTMPAVTTGTISVSIPDNTPAGVANTLSVSGVPATAVLTGISVTLNATHTWNSDLSFNLRAPNGKILNLVNGKGGSGDGFTNAIISSTGTASLPTAATTPVTGTFAADAALGAGATGFVSNASSFADLYNVGNGNWTLAVRDGALGDAGALTGWSITLTYGQPNPVVTWSPVTGLYTNAAATTAYQPNANAASVYVKPAGTSTYTVTSTSQFGCTTTSNVTVTVNANPVINLATLPSRICLSDTLVPLSATPVGGTWSGIGVSGSNLVPPAASIGTYPLTYSYTNAAGCTSTASTLAKIEDCPERRRLLRDDAVLLYPNPNNGQFRIRVNSTLYNKLVMTVYTTGGHVARKQQFTGLNYGRELNIDLTSLPGGTYMVQFYYEGGPRTSEKTFTVVVGR
jgi:subtilisin-like proprotein convertase family protein